MTNSHEPKILTEQDCLIALMVSITIADGNVRTAELVKIQSAVNNLPIFGTYDWYAIFCLNVCTKRPMRCAVMLLRLTA